MSTTAPVELQQWRDAQEQSLRAEDSWLSLAGLFWLKEGANRFGSGDDQDLAFPIADCAAHLGTLVRTGRDVVLQAAEGVTLLVNGQAPTDAPLQVDGDGKYTPDIVSCDDVSFFVITRGERIGIRVRDRNSEVRRNFTGRTWYDYNPDAVVDAEFVAYEAGKTIPILNILGDVNDMPSPGYVKFTYAGQQCQLDATAAGNGLFFNFRDGTSGHSTYGAGRFLVAGAPQDGRVTIDFNRAFNPPCAFTIYATCPVAPLQNHLKVAIPAGETYQGEAH